jgi:dTDP-4-dehydrorhamnose 3,5-epimerase
MIFHETSLKDAWLIEIERRGDARGYFARTFCRDEFSAHGLPLEFPQQNMSFSASAGTMRGMHFQRAPHAEGKLIRCVRGSVHDVIIDLRPASPTFMKHEAFVLTGETTRQLYCPPGFAHGFQTLTDDVEMTYLMSASYAPGAADGVRYDDPAFAIAWPLAVTDISERDARWPLLDPAALSPATGDLLERIGAI